MDEPAPPRAPRRRWTFSNALGLAALALAFALGALAHGYYTASRLEQDLGKRLGELDGRVKESRALASQAQEGTREALIRLGRLENQLADAQSQQIALEALYQEMSRGRDEWALAEIEQTLLTASEALQLAGNVQSALIALQSADARLARLDKPRLLPLRKAINADIQRLQALPLVDTPGLSLRLDALAASVNTLPLAFDGTPPARPAPARDTAPRNGWQRFADEAREDLLRLVRIQRMDDPAAPLLTPAQGAALRENLRLRLLSARLALLQHDAVNYRNDLAAVEAALRHYFDTRAQPTQAALASVRQLAAATVSVTLPDLSASLDALRALKRSTR
jgi:uroporphyrin-3 C-methyltransferase